MTTLFAQGSASFRQNEHLLNAGGHPDHGVVLSSGAFRLRLDALGDALDGPALASASFRMSPGFVGAYPPPGEVTSLRLDNAMTLTWDPEASAGTYHLYRGLLGMLPGTYGACFPPPLGLPTGADPALPPVGSGWFYLVTVSNNLAEEGTKGRTSSGIERGNPAPCP
jgi:hypothetical protein